MVKGRLVKGRLVKGQSVNVGQRVCVKAGRVRGVSAHSPSQGVVGGVTGGK